MTTPTPRADVLREAADRALFVIEHYAEYDRRSVSHVDCGGEPGIHDPLVIEAARLRAALATPAHPEPGLREQIEALRDQAVDRRERFVRSRDWSLADKMDGREGALNDVLALLPTTTEAPE